MTYFGRARQDPKTRDLNRIRAEEEESRLSWIRYRRDTVLSCASESYMTSVSAMSATHQAKRNMELEGVMLHAGHLQAARRVPILSVADSGLCRILGLGSRGASQYDGERGGNLPDSLKAS